MHEPPYRTKNMMPGMIMGWPWSIASIPSGWHLCDGTMGTPDYRNYYLVCAGGDHAPGDIVGSNSQTHDFTGDGHDHDLIEGNVIPSEDPNGLWEHNTSSNPASGTTDAADNRPLSKAINWIMKL